MMRSLYREWLRKPRVETPPSANGRNSIVVGGGGRRGSGGRKGSKDLSEVMAKRRSESYAMPPSGEIGFLEAAKEQGIGGGGGGSSLGASAKSPAPANAIFGLFGGQQSRTSSRYVGGGGGNSAAAEAAAKAQIERFRQHESLLNGVLDCDFAESEATLSLSEDAKAELTMSMLSHILTNALEANDTQALLIIEDAQWMDSASWAFLNRLAGEEQPERRQYEEAIECELYGRCCIDELCGDGGDRARVEGEGPRAGKEHLAVAAAARAAL